MRCYNQYSCKNKTNGRNLPNFTPIIIVIIILYAVIALSYSPIPNIFYEKDSFIIAHLFGINVY